MSYDYWIQEAMRSIKKQGKRVDDLEDELNRVKTMLKIPDVCLSCGASMDAKPEETEKEGEL